MGEKVRGRYQEGGERGGWNREKGGRKNEPGIGRERKKWERSRQEKKELGTEGGKAKGIKVKKKGSLKKR